MTETPFVPPEFVPPRGLADPRFVLEPLGPQHNERDYAAWTSSVEHIHATPGFIESSWPHEMTLEENRADLERHERDFAGRTGFTYTVLDPGDGDVIGCLYIYPRKDGATGAQRHVVGARRPGRPRRPARRGGGGVAGRGDWPFETVRATPAASRSR